MIDAAVIGYGFGGRVFHAPPIAKTEGFRLKAVVSGRKEEIARDYPGVAALASPDEVFADPAIGLIAISTPNTAHFDLAARALAAGKHVVVDKPFTVSTAEARELARRAEAVGRMLMVFHNFRYYADYLALKQMMAEGTLGEIHYFESRFDRYTPTVPDAWREKPGPGAGTWWDLGPHLVDQVLQLFGRPQALYADLGAQRAVGGATDYFHVLLRYERLRVVLGSCFVAPEDSLRLVVHGSRASLIKHGIDTREGPDPRPGTLIFPGGATQTAPSAVADGCAFYKAVRDAILGKAPNPVALDDAIAVMEILEAAEVSATERREVML